MAHFSPLCRNWNMRSAHCGLISRFFERQPQSLPSLSTIAVSDFVHGDKYLTTGHSLKLIKLRRELGTQTHTHGYLSGARPVHKALPYRRPSWSPAKDPWSKALALSVVNVNIEAAGSKGEVIWKNESRYEIIWRFH